MFLPLFSLVCLVFVLTSSAAINLPGHVSLCMCARIAGYRLYIFHLIRCREAVHHTVGMLFVWAQVLSLSFTLCVTLPLWLCLLISKTMIVVVIAYGRLPVVLQYPFSLCPSKSFRCIHDHPDTDYISQHPPSWMWPCGYMMVNGIWVEVIDIPVYVCPPFAPSCSLGERQSSLFLETESPYRTWWSCLVSHLLLDCYRENK